MAGGEAFWQPLEGADDDETVDTATGFVVTTSSPWGVTATGGRPYYDPAGAVSGEEATFHATPRPHLLT